MNKFLDEIVDGLENNHPFIHIGFQVDPDENVRPTAWVDRSDVPANVFRVKIDQKFPVLDSTGKIRSTDYSYNIYVGRVLNIEEMLGNSELLRDDIRDRLIYCMSEGTDRVVLADVADRYKKNGKVFLYPLMPNDGCVSTTSELLECVSLISDLHGDYIQQPIKEAARQYRKIIDTDNN